MRLASQRAIKEFARGEPSVLLPAHDPDAAERLANRQVMFEARTATTGAAIAAQPGVSRSVPALA